MDGGGNMHRHNFLEARTVEKQFIDAIEENAEYLRAAEGIDYWGREAEGFRRYCTST
ncbi:MAG: hypothetical protein M1474_01795 [Candidatus Marsarchaeota archaeon]|nr:hypothetical protein [Candidatus Marsarchaeota archaeon]